MGMVCGLNKKVPTIYNLDIAEKQQGQLNEYFIDTSTISVNMQKNKNTKETYNAALTWHDVNNTGWHR